MKKPNTQVLIDYILNEETKSMSGGERRVCCYYLSQSSKFDKTGTKIACFIS